MNDLVEIHNGLTKKLGDVKSSVVDGDKRITKLSLYKDDEWDMSEYVNLPTASDSSKLLRFSRIAGDQGIDPRVYQGFVIPFKDFCHAKMFDSNEFEKPASPLTIYNHLVSFRVFVLWCASQRIVNIEDVTKYDLNDYIKFLSSYVNDDNKSYSPSRIQSLLSVLPLLYAYRDKTTFNFSFNPFKGKSLKQISGNTGRSEENKTVVIPENLYKPLMKEAYNYVMNYSHDLLNVKELVDNEEKRLREQNNLLSNSGLNKRLAKGRKAVFNTYKYENASTPKIETMRSFLAEMRALRAASIIIVIGLGGMRISEFYSLESGCLEDNSESGVHGGKIYLHGLVYKGKGSAPTRETWVVDKTVKQAVEILEALTSYYHEFTDMRNLVMLVRAKGSRHSLDLKGSLSTEDYADGIKMPSTSSILKNINSFANMFQEVTDNKEGDFKFTTRQFRRTLAHQIAKEPFGIIAGMLQYKHVESAIFEGYAGHDISFLELINKERALSTIDFMEQITIDAEDGELAGSKGEDILDMFSGASGDRKGKDVSYYLKNTRMNIYAGMFNYCFFDPDVALCLKDTKAKDMPIMNACHPDVCKNSCISKAHLPAWESQKNDVNSMLKQKGISENQEGVLKAQLVSLESVINPLTRNSKKENGDV